MEILLWASTGIAIEKKKQLISFSYNVNEAKERILGCLFVNVAYVTNLKYATINRSVYNLLV
jgi:hypothetical protein